VSEGGIQIWSVFNADDRLVLAMSNEPGEFNFTRLPDDDVEPIECRFATLQCYFSHEEPQILNLLFRSRDLADFIDQLMCHGYKVRPGRPTPAKFARL
jgi:hypothetical protein